MPARQRDFGALHKIVFGDAQNAVAAAGADGAEQDGAYVDARGYETVTLALAVEATLGESETVTIDMNAQTDADGTGTGTDFGTAATQVTLTGGSGGSTENALVEIDLNLNHSDFLGYIRGQYTIDASATGADTWRAGLVYVLGGAQELPAA